MMNYTNLIKKNGYIKIERYENKLDAIINAWEAKTSGNSVKVVDDATCKIIYK